MLVDERTSRVPRIGNSPPEQPSPAPARTAQPWAAQRRPASDPAWRNDPLLPVPGEPAVDDGPARQATGADVRLAVAAERCRPLGSPRRDAVGPPGRPDAGEPSPAAKAPPVKAALLVRRHTDGLVPEEPLISRRDAAGPGGGPGGGVEVLPHDRGAPRRPRREALGALRPVRPAGLLRAHLQSERARGSRRRPAVEDRARRDLGVLPGRPPGALQGRGRVRGVRRGGIPGPARRAPRPRARRRCCAGPATTGSPSCAPTWTAPGRCARRASSTPSRTRHKGFLKAPPRRPLISPRPAGEPPAARPLARLRYWRTRRAPTALGRGSERYRRSPKNRPWRPC